MNDKRVEIGGYLVTKHFLDRWQERFSMDTKDLITLLNQSKRIKKCKLNKYKGIASSKRHRHGIKTRFYLIHNILFIKHGEVFVTCFSADSYGVIP